MKKLIIILFLLLNYFTLYAYKFEMRKEKDILADIKKSPKNVYLYVELGDVYKSNNKLKKAMKYYKKAVKIDSGNAKGYYGISDVLRKNEKYNQALDNALIASKLKPLKVRYKGQIGLIYYKQNKLKESEKYFKEAISLAVKKKGFYYSMLGNIYKKQGKYKKAIEMFKKQLDEKTWDKSIYVSIAYTYYKMGDKKNGDYYKKLAGEEWGKTKGFFSEKGSKSKFKKSKGWAFYKKKDYKKAVSVFKKDLKSDPGNLDSYMGLGYTYRKMNKSNDALKEFNKAIKIDESYGKAYVGRAMIYIKQKKYKKASEDLEFGIMANPEDKFAAGQLGNAYVNLERYEEAIPQLKKALGEDKKDVYLIKLLARSYQKMKDYKQARIWYKKALSKARNKKDKKYIKGSVAFVTYMYAGDLEKEGKEKLAKKMYKDVIKTDPKSKWAGYSKQRLR